MNLARIFTKTSIPFFCAFFSFLLLFFLSPTPVVLAQAPPSSRPASSATKNIEEACEENLRTGAISAEQFSSGCSAFTFVGQNSAKNGTPGTADSLLEGAIVRLIGSPSREIITVQGEKGTMFAGGAIQTSTAMMAKAYTNMPSSIEYIADISNSLRNPFGAEPAYAQGLGFSSLAPVLGIWKLMRNLAYFFFVVIFLVIGFLIMFRSKIGGQAAVTVQQALPKLIVSLLLVTFSYAIAGLMIDAMYLIIYLMIGVFSASNVFSGGIVPGMGPLIDIAFRNNIITNMMGLIGNAVGDIAGAVGNIAVNTLGLEPTWVSGWVVQGAANVVVTLVLAIFILVSVFRVFFALLQAYVSIFFSVIFAPIQLLIGAIPGKNTFSDWIGNLFDNIIVFPAVIFILLIAFYFSNPQSRALANSVISGSTIASTQLRSPQSSGSLWESLPLADLTSPQTAQAAGFSAPQLGSNQGDGSTTYLSLVALGAIGILPDVIKIAKGVRKGQLGVDMSAVGQNLAKGWNGAEVVPGLGFTKIGARSLMPDRVANAVPFGFGDTVPFRTKGKETGLERLLIGSREERKRELDYQRQAALFGRNVRIRQGGIAGAIMNASGAESAAGEQRGAGAGSDKD